MQSEVSALELLEKVRPLLRDVLSQLVECKAPAGQRPNYDDNLDNDVPEKARIIWFLLSKDESEGEI